MATKSEVKVIENRAALKIGYNEVVMPLAAACEIMQLFLQASRWDSEYVDGATKHYVGGDLPEIGIRIVSMDNYTEGLINGAKKQS